MPVFLDDEGRLFEFESYSCEAELERDVVTHAEQLLGASSIYIDVKKALKSKSNIVTIPHGYVIDMADPESPKLFIVENEIVRHDPFKHVGTQLLKFVISFDDSRRSIRNFIMKEINKNSDATAQLEKGAEVAGSRNVDAYLDDAVYSDFRGIVIIDEAREELH